MFPLAQQTCTKMSRSLIRQSRDTVKYVPGTLAQVEENHVGPGRLIRRRLLLISISLKFEFSNLLFLRRRMAQKAARLKSLDLSKTAVDYCAFVDWHYWIVLALTPFSAQPKDYRLKSIRFRETRSYEFKNRPEK